MRILALSLVFASAAVASAQSLAGLWDFNDSLNATVGTQPALNLGAFSYGDFATPNGTQRCAVWTDKFTRIQIPNTATRAISGLTENYTLVMDIAFNFAETFNGFDNNWASIYDTRTFHDGGDGELFFNMNTTTQVARIGNDGQYGGALNSNTMYRVVVVSDTADADGIDIYVDGTYIRSISDRDVRWFLGDAFGINEDDDEEQKPGALNLVGLYDGVVSQANIATLGAAGAAVPSAFASNVTGTVTLGDFGGTVAGRSITVEFVGGSTVTTTLTAAGNFSVTAPAAGTYDVRIKGSHWLSKVVSGVVVTGAGASGVNASLINGDVDGDNEVGPGDFGGLATAFLSVPGDSNWNEEADLDGDGEVGPGDFGILANNFLTAGE